MSKVKPSRTRQQVVAECVEAVESCWGHYSDVKLTDEQVTLIKRALFSNLPVGMTCEQWKRYATEYQAKAEVEGAIL